MTGLERILKNFGTTDPIVIKKPETFDEVGLMLDPFSREARYLKYLCYSSNLEEVQDYLDAIYEGITIEEAYEKQLILLFNQKQPQREFIASKAQDIDWAVEQAIELDDFYDRRDRFERSTREK